MEKVIRVVFLDDEESILDGIQRLFIKEPYGVFTTASVEKAKEMIAHGQVKVVVSDQRMPQIQGVKFLQEVKSRWPDTVRILFTGYTDFSAAEEAINLGEVYRFVSKPWKTAELLLTIRQSIEHYDLVLEARSKREELEISHKKLKELYEMQKEFTSTVSHELRTPLASIKTAIDLVVKKALGEINADQTEALTRAKNNVDRLKRLIDDILDLTKIESGKLNMNFLEGDIQQVIQEVVDAQKDVVESKGLSLKTDFDLQIPKVFFDRDRLVQVLNNLLNNATKFTKQGSILVRTQDKSVENHVLVSIVDTGKGIAADDMKKLFQKFQQVESAHTNEEGGTGLGLAICREIVTRHGGKIWAESQPGVGTVVSFILPIKERRVPV